jgi:hypothetical protein
MATQKNQAPKAATTPATQASQDEGAVRQVLQVVSKRDGFRRAGRAWHGTSTVPLDELTRKQYEQLTTEPMLVTMLLEVPADQVDELAAADGAAGGQAGT